MDELLINEQSCKLIDQEGEIINIFIFKVYTLFSIQLTVTLGIIIGCYYSKSATNFIFHQHELLLLSLIGTFLSIFLSWCYGKVHPFNYMILGVFTACEAYMVTYICLFYQPVSIIIAGGLTLSIFASLSIYTLITNHDFNFIGAGLFAGLVVLIIGSIIQIIIPITQLFNMTIAVCCVLIASGYILYDTSDMLYRLTPDDFIFACMSLYIDIIRLFVILFIRLLELTSNIIKFIVTNLYINLF